MLIPQRLENDGGKTCALNGGWDQRHANASGHERQHARENRVLNGAGLNRAGYEQILHPACEIR
jgi:hypothetical protein